jgi:hypothetical protein
MADLTVTAARLRKMEAIEARLIPMIADEAINKGQVVYRKANGNAGLARGNAVGTSKVVGVATTSVLAGVAFEALHYGRLAGYDLSGVDPGETMYLSAATAGAIADTAPSTAGQVVVPIGTVHTMTDVPRTKFLFVDVSLSADYAAIEA